MQHSSDRFIAEFRRRIVLPMAVIMVAAFGLAGGLLYGIATEQDQRAVDQSIRAVSRLIEARQEVLAKALKDYSAWGAAYEHLHSTFSREWAFDQENVGATLFKSYGFEYIFLLNPQNETIYTVTEGAESTVRFQDVLSRGADILVDRARKAGPNETVVESGVLQVGNDLVLASAATLSTGGDTSVAVQPGAPSILVFAERLTAAKLDAAAGELGVSHLRAQDGATSSASFRIPFVNGETAALRWDPEQPGAALLQAVVPWLALAAGALTLFVALVFRHAAKAATIITESASKLAAAHQRAEHQAHHDVTTGLPNRLSLAAHMDAALAGPGGRLVVVYADLDRFKPINDSLGHPAGDHVLITVAQRLREALREGDIVARVGGDEFVLVVAGMAEHDVEALCRRLLAEVTAPIAWEGTEVHVGLSMGIAMSPTDATTTNELIRRADLALYQAKSDGRGTYRFFAQEMNDRIIHRQSLENDLRRGLAEGEFTLHYQPRYDTREMRLLSVEALVRWRHPRRGLISPAEFIPLAEETGLIVQLGECILRTACSDIARFGEIGISVNVSPVQFRSGELPGAVQRILTDTGLAPSRLELELTEGVLLEDTQRAQAMLRDLKALGIRLTMDDFGTGYSSLGNLRSFPFDGIKIDRQFVADLGGTGDARAIVQAIVALGKALGMTVTAEGVETAEQLLLLRHDACEEVQGFYMSHPVPAAELEALMPRHPLRTETQKGVG